MVMRLSISRGVSLDANCLIIAPPGSSVAENCLLGHVPPYRAFSSKFTVLTCASPTAQGGHGSSFGISLSNALVLQIDRGTSGSKFLHFRGGGHHIGFLGVQHYYVAKRQPAHRLSEFSGSSRADFLFS